MPDSAGKTIVEVLYPEYANQAGDNGNAMYLRACLPVLSTISLKLRLPRKNIWIH